MLPIANIKIDVKIYKGPFMFVTVYRQNQKIFAIGYDTRVAKIQDIVRDIYDNTGIIISNADMINAINNGKHVEFYSPWDELGL